MKSITRVEAMNYAINAINANTDTDKQVVEILTKIRDSIAKSNARKATDKQTEARKAKTAEARSKAMETILPVLRETFAKFNMGITSTELFEAAKDKLPEGYTVNQVKYILAHDMASEVDKMENGRNPFLYRMKESA